MSFVPFVVGRRHVGSTLLHIWITMIGSHACDILPNLDVSLRKPLLDITNRVGTNPTLVLLYYLHLLKRNYRYLK